MNLGESGYMLHIYLVKKKRDCRLSVKTVLSFRGMGVKIKKLRRGEDQLLIPTI